MDESPTALSIAEIGTMLRAFPAALLAEIGALPAAVVAWRPGPDEWCANEVVGHLIEAEERGFASRVRSLLVANDPVFETWDPPAIARERRDDERPVGELLKTFLEARLASAVLVEQLVDDDLGRAGIHPEVSRLTIADLLGEWVHHDREHLRQILANVQGYLWPQLGGAQAFKTGAVM